METGKAPPSLLSAPAGGLKLVGQGQGSWIWQRADLPGQGQGWPKERGTWTLHTTLTMALPRPRNTDFCTSGQHTCNKLGMFGMHLPCTAALAHMHCATDTSFICQTWYAYTALSIYSTSQVHSFDPHRGPAPASALP